MIDFLLSLDHWVFLRINQGWASPFLDTVFTFVTDVHKNKILSALLILLLVGACVKRFGKNFWKAILYVVLCVSLTDAFCYRIIKHAVQRDRPFQSESFQSQVRKAGEAHGPSFPSNHAANTFAGAASLSVLFPNFAAFFYTYAAFVALSRVYLGVHFPSDVVFGAMVGVFVSLLIRKVLRNQLKSFTGLKT